MSPTRTTSCGAFLSDKRFLRLHAAGGAASSSYDHLGTQLQETSLSGPKESEGWEGDKVIFNSL